jgi:hypothetical protein
LEISQEKKKEFTSLPFIYHLAQVFQRLEVGSSGNLCYFSDFLDFLDGFDSSSAISSEYFWIPILNLCIGYFLAMYSS